MGEPVLEREMAGRAPMRHPARARARLGRVAGRVSMAVDPLALACASRQPSRRRIPSAGSSCAAARAVARRAGVVVCVLSAAALLIGVSPALAVETHVLSSSFGSVGSGAGKLSSPLGVAVNDTTGDVYVADTGNDRVDEFDSSGNFVRAWGWGVADSASSFETCTTTCAAGVAGSGAGEFKIPTSIAVDNSTGASAGDVYVGDTGDNLVTKFTASGSLVSSWGSGGQLDGSTATGGPFTSVAGITVDPSGNLNVYDPNSNNWFVFAQDGTAEPTVSVGRGTNNVGIGVDGSGNFYKVVGNGNVEQFSSSGTDIGDLTDDQNPGPITGFTIDPSSNDVYAVDGGGSIRHYAGSSLSTCVPANNCAAADTFGASRLVAATGIAVNPASGTVFVVNGDQVDLFTGPVQVPDVTASAATGVGHNSATLNGSVDPAGAGNVTSCEFEYVDDADFQLSRYTSASTVPCSQATPITSPATVSANVPGLTAGTTYHFELVASNANGQGSSYDQTLQDQTLTTPPAVAGLSTDPATNIGPSTATLNGSLDPAGQDTTYHFQYTTSADFQADGYANATSVPVPDADAGSTPGEASVTPVNVSGLTAGTSYTFRIVATNTFGATDGNDQAFATPPPPSIDGASATNLTTTAADLNAQINPNGTDTTYHFEYGTSTSYGSSLPVPDADIGAGTSDVAVTQQLTGLSANTTYHWRVVATNPSGTTRGVDHTFIYTTTGQGLPDNRAYEMVTPPQKNGAVIGYITFGGRPDIAQNGSRVVIFSIQCFGQSSSCTATRDSEGEPYAFDRTAGGWQTTAYAPPASTQGGNSSWLSNADTGTALFSSATAPDYEDDWVARESHGGFADLGPATQPALGPDSPQFWNEGNVLATADVAKVVWNVNVPGSNGRGLWPPDPSTDVGAYEYSGVGSTRPLFVGVSGGFGSTDLISACGTSVGSPLGNNNLPGSMSADGNTIYFTALHHAGGSACFGSGANSGTPVPADAIYARIDNSEPDAHTVAISQRSPTDCTTAACMSSSPSDAAFEGAASDGTRAFFTSTQQLTNDASQDPNPADSAASGCNQTTGANGCNLYMYDFSQPTGHELVDVSAGDSSGNGPRVQGVMAISADGSHVYFVSEGVLTAEPNAEGDTAQDGADNLYMYERDASHPSGRIAFIGTLLSSDDSSTSLVVQLWSEGPTLANVTPDGRSLVFPSAARLTSEPANASGAPELFRYDAQTGQLNRISVGEHGFNDNGNSSTGTASIVPAQNGDYRAGAARNDPTMSDDGTRVFFTSPAALTPRALDDVPIDSQGDLAQNVYEWEQAGVGSCPAGDTPGCVYLISDGHDATATGGFSSVELLGSDSTGDNVFFGTADQLVAQDTDTERDFYDARVGGGFPSSSPNPCSGDTCQGTPSGQPSPPDGGTLTFFGPGNSNSGTTSPAKVKIAKKPIRGTAFVLTVKVPGKGRITLTGRGVRAVKKTVARAGTYELRVAMTRAEKRLLAHRQKLKLTLTVRYAPSTGSPSSATATIIVRKPR